MKQNITKQQVYDFGIAPENLQKLGKLVHRDYEGVVNGLRLFEKLTLETAIDGVVDEIVKDFNIGKMIEILDDNLFEISQDFKPRSFVVTLSGLKIFGSKELCDALWEAVKFTIN